MALRTPRILLDKHDTYLQRSFRDVGTELENLNQVSSLLRVDLVPIEFGFTHLDV